MIENPLRALFPQFSDPSPSVYLDSAATSHKPQSVIERIEQFYRTENSNVHRSSHAAASHLTAQFEAVRQQVQMFIGAASSDEIIWTKGATESINLVAACLNAQHLKPNGELLISGLEHHANLVPWQQMAQRFGLTLRIMPVNAQGILELEQSLLMLNNNTVLMAIAQVSNALGNLNPLTPLLEQARKVGALTLVDGAQAVSHFKVDVQALGCDFYVFSAHKMYGPTGLGVLYGRRQVLDTMLPYQFGGEMIEHVTYQQSRFQALPYKFEAGTPNIAGVLGLGAAMTFVQQHRSNINRLEHQLYQHLLTGLQQIPGLRLWGDLENSVALQSFTVEGQSLQDVAILLNQHNIALRAGHHCAMPLMQHLGIEGTLRVSLACYNTMHDIDCFLQALSTVVEQLRAIKPDTASQLPAADLVQEFQQADSALVIAIKAARGWDQVYRQIMLAGRDLNRLADAFKTEEYAVFGCESQVWLRCSLRHGCVHIEADSSSKIIRGLLAIIIAVLAAKTPEQILRFNLHDYLAELGLVQHLSQSRGNGLKAVVDQIMQFCRAQLS